MYTLSTLYKCNKKASLRWPVEISGHRYNQGPSDQWSFGSGLSWALNMASSGPARTPGESRMEEEESCVQRDSGISGTANGLICHRIIFPHHFNFKVPHYREAGMKEGGGGKKRWWGNWSAFPAQKPAINILQAWPLISSNISVELCSVSSRKNEFKHSPLSPTAHTQGCLWYGPTNYKFCF